MSSLQIVTKAPKQVIDITDRVDEYLATLEVRNGLCSVSVQHTTAGLTTADLDAGTDEDFLEMLQRMVPKMDFRHAHDPQHTPDHIWASLIGSTATLPVRNGQLVLGMWQRVVLVELNGPRERRLMVTVVAAG